MAVLTGGASLLVTGGTKTTVHKNSYVKIVIIRGMKNKKTSLQINVSIEKRK